MHPTSIAVAALLTAVVLAPAAAADPLPTGQEFKQMINCKAPSQGNDLRATVERIGSTACTTSAAVGAAGFDFADLTYHTAYDAVCTITGVC